MKRSHVQSSAVLSVGYDPKDRALEIEFSGGSLYRYRDVPPAEYVDLLQSTSKGEFINTHIKPRHDCTILRRSPPPLTV